jgi:hypothetical protein
MLSSIKLVMDPQANGIDAHMFGIKSGDGGADEISIAGAVGCFVEYPGNCLGYRWNYRTIELAKDNEDYQERVDSAVQGERGRVSRKLLKLR